MNSEREQILYAIFGTHDYKCEMEPGDLTCMCIERSARERYELRYGRGEA